MPTITTESPNIAVLDSQIIADLCAGKFYIDITPSEFIGDGSDNILGANVQITSPAGVIVKPFGENYEIAPALSGGLEAVITFNVPTVASTYYYGIYTVLVQMYDADGTMYEIEKTVKICAPDSNYKQRNYGSLSSQLKGNCQDGKVFVIVDGVPAYNGKAVESQVNDFAFEYPSGSGLDNFETTQTNFTVQLFEGEYKIEGTICATYNYGDNVYVKVNYKVKRKKDQKCLIDMCCVQQQLTALAGKITSDCTDEEKNITGSTIVEALLYIKEAELAAECGADPSDAVTRLEELLGCSCTCNCNEGTPIINASPSTDVIINGCGFTKETVGLTTTYTINNYDYVVKVVENGGALTGSAASIDGCTKTFQLTFNIAKVYQQIKAQINNHTEYNTWAAFINNTLNDFDISCLDVTAQQWAVMTFKQRMQVIANGNCIGGVCEAVIDEHTATQDGVSLIFAWSAPNADSVDIYLEGTLIANVIASIGTFSYPIPTNTDRSFAYRVIPKCKNSTGDGVAGTVTIEMGTYVAPPSIYAPHLSGICPMDLTTNVHSLPLGVTVEWHTANNYLAATLVPDPTQAMGGTYYAFAVDAHGFYSTGVMVTVVCDASGSCSAPQNLSVLAVAGGHQVQFMSASYPPPLNSYTVKRKLASDPDVAGSYTTLGTPVWNASASRWILTDTSAVANILYTYRAISNCGSTNPYIDFEFAKIGCPVLTLTPYATDVAYSFTGVGGEVDKYEVTIYSDNGVTAVHTDTHNTPFSTPITGRFLYLDGQTQYYVGVKAFIGDYEKECSLQTIDTLKESLTLVIDYVAGIWSATLDGVLASDINLSGTTAIGSNDDCVTPFETDTMPSMTLEAGETGVENETADLSYLSEKYSLDDVVLITDEFAGTIFEGGTGGTFTIDGQEVTVQINHTSCGYYPA